MVAYNGCITLEYEMKKCIRKLLYSSLAALVSIGINFNAEARVTREVAEATLPYLMEAAGIPQAQQTQAQRDAIISMIYTDTGQREIWNWAVNDVQPQTLYNQFQMNWPIQSSNIVFSPNAQPSPERIFQLLFPRGPGTFSSYNHHSSRLGRWCLNSNGNLLVNICTKLLRPPVIPNATNESKIRSNLLSVAPLDTKLACVLFVLDICDTADQIFNILDELANLLGGIANYQPQDIAAGQAGTRGNPIPSVYNEYNIRPVPATAAIFGQPQRQQGDCVQTLYRHLINIAAQNDNCNPRNLNIGHLLEGLRGYYTTRHGVINHDDGIITVPVTETEAGLTQLIHHQSWHDALVATVPGGTDITNGAIDNIVTVLEAIRPSNMSTSALNAIARVYKAPFLNPAIPTSTGVGGAGTNQQANATAIQNALNALDGRCNVGNERFIVSVTDHIDDPQVITIKPQLPTDTDLVIQIADRLWNRKITIGARTAGKAHAEIISIITPPQ